MPHTNCLHVYGQPWQREGAIITGDRESLTNLRAAIDWVLRTAPDAARPRLEGYARIESFVNDDEGYSLHVALLLSEDMARLETPYIDASEAGTSPWGILQQHGWLGEEDCQ